VLARSLAGADPADLTPAARQRLADAALPPPAHGPDVPAGAPDPSGRAWAWSSALMDVGALHCRPRPRCEGCPLAPSCRWRALGPAAPPPRPRAQAPFATSDRRWRGAVVRALAAAPGGMDRASLADAVQADAAGRPAGWFDTLLSRLEAEGMVATGADGRLRLPA
jgi:A/G-specific adenine glycosylase